MRAKNKELMDLIRKYPVGTKVLCSREMLRRWDGKEGGVVLRKWKTADCPPFFAWVVGATWVCDGHVKPGSTYPRTFEEPAEYDPPTFVAKKKTPVLLVRRSMFAREIRVPADSVVADNPHVHPADIPLFARSVSWDERARESLRKEMKAVPRDERGRWMRVPTHERYPGSV